MEISAEVVSQLVSQNQMLIQTLVKEQVGHTYNNQEKGEKIGQLVQKVAAGTMTAQNMHGLGGTFSTFGLNRDIINTHVQAVGLARELPILPTIEEDPRYGALTGFSDDIGNEPAEPCDDAPTGFLKACNLTAQFGRVARATDTIEMDAVGLKINRGEFTDLRLRGLDFGDSSQAGLMPRGLTPAQIVNQTTMAEAVSVGVRLNRELNRQIWVGSPANNNAGGGFAEFPGLDNQITTGQVDADSGIACQSMDSDIKDFNYQDVAAGGNNDIVQFISMLEYFIWSLAEDTGMMPARWAFVMRPQLWHELSRVWPIIYNTDRVAIALANAANARVTLDGRGNIEQRDRMRNTMEIAVNGRVYPVIKDNSINEQNNENDANLPAGSFASSIYMIPLAVQSNFRVLFRQYKNYSAITPEFNMMRGKQNFWTDGGIFSWAVENNKWCIKMTAKTEQRIVLLTPQLAGRIDNVRYDPLQHLRDPNPDSPYFVDGGVSIRAVPAKNAVWL